MIAEKCKRFLFFFAGSAHTSGISSPDFNLHSQHAPATNPRLAKRHGCND